MMTTEANPRMEEPRMMNVSAICRRQATTVGTMSVLDAMPDATHAKVTKLGRGAPNHNRLYSGGYPETMNDEVLLLGA